MNKLDNTLLKLVKQGFVPSGGLSEPVAGASDMTAGLASGGIGQAPGGTDPNAAPVDPAAAGGDPMAAGGAPADPAAGGQQLPPELMQALSGMAPMPNGAGAGSPASGSPGTITISIPDLIQLVQAFGGGAKKKPAGDGTGAAPAAGGAAPDLSGITEKLDKVLQALNPASAGASMSGTPTPPVPGAAPAPVG